MPATNNQQILQMNGEYITMKIDENDVGTVVGDDGTGSSRNSGIIISEGISILDITGRRANITLSNAQSQNGIVHVVESVLLTAAFS